MKITKIGAFDSNGFPDGWEVDGSEIIPRQSDYALMFHADGRVLVNNIEVVPWTEARRRAADLGSLFKKEK